MKYRKVKKVQKQIDMLIEVNDFEKARDLGHYLATKTNMTEYYVQLAFLQYSCGNVDPKLYSSLIKIKSKNPELLFELGVLAYNVGDFEKSKEKMKIVLELEPKNIEALIIMAEILAIEKKDFTNYKNRLFFLGVKDIKITNYFDKIEDFFDFLALDEYKEAKSILPELKGAISDLDYYNILGHYLSEVKKHKVADMAFEKSIKYTIESKDLDLDKKIEIIDDTIMYIHDSEVIDRTIDAQANLVLIEMIGNPMSSKLLNTLKSLAKDYGFNYKQKIREFNSERKKVFPQLL